MNIPRPEGFVVNELFGDYATGECTHFTLKKVNHNTLSVIKLIAKQLRVSVERFGYAGLKDKHAITTQRVSAWRVPIKWLKRVKIRDVELSDFKEGLERVRIGSHKGNKFLITIKGVKLEELREPINVPNLFGEQRFKGNELLGKALINREWGEVINLLKDNNGGYERRALNHYNRTGKELESIKLIDKRVRVLWVNAWQAKQWNESINTSINEQPLRSYEPIPEMPELGRFTGGLRRTIMSVKDYKATSINDGVMIEFTLNKGSYATTLIKFITNQTINS